MKVKIVDKKIILPEIKLFKNDFGLDTLVFSIDKTYNGKDLTTLSAYLNFKRSDGVLGKIFLEKSINEKTLNLTYVVGNEITAITGQVDMQISFSDEESFSMATEIFTIDVQKRINGGEVVESGQVELSVLNQQFVARTEYVAYVESMMDFPTRVTNLESYVNDLDVNTEKKNAYQKVVLKEVFYDADGNLIVNDTSYLQNLTSDTIYDIDCIDEAKNKLTLYLNVTSFERGRDSTVYLKTGVTEVSIEGNAKIKLYGDGVVDNGFLCEINSKYEIIVHFNGLYFEVFLTKME